MPAIEMWIALSENGDHKVAIDADTAIQRLNDGSAEDLAGTACRLIKLKITMSEPCYRDDDDEIDKTVDVTIPDDAGRTIEVETE